MSSADILVCGNTVVDALLWILSRNVERSPDDFSPELRSVLSSSLQIVLVTAHRRENLGLPLDRSCEALRRLVEEDPGVTVVYPVHQNPAVSGLVTRLLSDRERIHLLPPQSYADFVLLMNRCHFVVTDSGGVQEEAPALGKPVLVLRRETERREGVPAGTAKLVGTQVDHIVREAELLLNDAADNQRMSRASRPYGDGRAAQRIVEHILAKLG